MTKAIGVLLMSLAISGAGAHAMPLVISGVDGGWQNVSQREPRNAVITNSAGGTDLVEWGGGIRRSSYAFTPVSGNITPLLDMPFAIGTFTYVNNDILSPSIRDVEYELTFQTNAMPTALADVLFFDHLETNNVAPCRGGIDGPSQSVCDDFVTVSSLAVNRVLDIGGSQLFFSLLGFATDSGGPFVHEFQSPEDSTTSAELFALVSLLPLPVPAPGTAPALLAAGLAWWLSRRRSSRAIG